jgi:nucleotide-binding universal stress UspA family protein
MKTTFRIVAGVDGSEGGHRALAWAVQEAAARGGTVQAVSAWSFDGVEIGPVVTADRGSALERAQRLLHTEVTAVRAGYDTPPPVAAEAVEGRPAAVLIRAAGDADLLVLGSHGHSRMRHTVLGSVSDECVRHAACPVVVIPVPASRPAHPSTETLVPS